MGGWLKKTAKKAKKGLTAKGLTKGALSVLTLGQGGKIEDAWKDVSGSNQRQDAKKSQKKSEEAMATQAGMMQQALDYAKERDTQQLGYATDWYDEQRRLAAEDDARRAGITGRMYDNASSLSTELLGNADEYGGMGLRAADEYRTGIMGNADRLYNELTDNARYSDFDYQDATGVASADVVQAFNKARQTTRRNAQRMGLDPNSSDFARMESRGSLDQAAAEADAMNRTRRNMKHEERGRLNDAIMSGLTARGNAITQGYGAVDNAQRYAGNLKRDAYTTGRNAMDSVYRTDLGNRSGMMGLADPRMGLSSATLNQLNNNITGYGGQAAQYGNMANSQLQAGQAMMGDLIGAGAMIGGAMIGGPAGAAAAGSASRGLSGGGNYASPGYVPPGGSFGSVYDYDGTNGYGEYPY